MARGFIPFDIDQHFLLPPDLREWLPEGHLASFIIEVVAELDLSELMQAYAKNTERGRAGYNPRVLRLCQKAGLVKLGHVCIDGTKVKANASKHKAMSYERMCETEKRLQAEVDGLLAQAAATDAQEDAQEDAQYGKGKRGDELPEELSRRESRLVKIREAKAALEQEAKEKAQRQADDAKAKNKARELKEQETGKKAGGRPAQVPEPAQAKPEPKSQRNFTDPDSRIMKDGASKAFEQCYNAQAAVDSTAQIIVAAAVTQQANDKQQLVPPERQKHSGPGDQGDPRSQADSAAGSMREKLQVPSNRELYGQRKAVVEPVFGQTKEARGIRRFLLRGLDKASAEWSIICLTHNLLKLFRLQGTAAAALG